MHYALLPRRGCETTEGKSDRAGMDMLIQEIKSKWDMHHKWQHFKKMLNERVGFFGCCPLLVFNSNKLCATPS